MQNEFLLVSIWEIDVSRKRPNTAVIVSQLVLNSVLKNTIHRTATRVKMFSFGCGPLNLDIDYYMNAYR